MQNEMKTNKMYYLPNYEIKGTPIIHFNKFYKLHRKNSERLFISRPIKALSYYGVSRERINKAVEKVRWIGLAPNNEPVYLDEDFNIVIQPLNFYRKPTGNRGHKIRIESQCYYLSNLMLD